MFCLGDLGAFGPHPDRVFPLLFDNNVECIQGNYDHSIGNDLNDCQCGYTDPRDAIVTRTLNARLCIDGRESPLSMSVIPSTLDLAEAETTFSNNGDREFLLRNAIERIAEDFDYILFD